MAEAVILSARYHWSNLPEERLESARWLIDPILPAGLATAFVTVALRQELARSAQASPDGPYRRWPFVLGHLAAFVAFARASAYLVAGDPTTSPFLDARAIGRLIGDPQSSAFGPYLAGIAALLGVAALASWVAAVFPPRLQGPWRLRLWGPLLVGIGFGIIAAVAGRVTQATWPDLGRVTLWVVHRLLTLITRDVIYLPADAVVGTPAFTVWIAPACSGYEGMGLVLIYVGAYLWLDRRRLRFPRALLLLPIGAAAMWLANAIRLVGLVAVGSWWSPKAAIQGFHAQAGWLAFNAVALGLVLVAQRSRFLHSGPMAEARRTSPSAAYLAPMMAMVATAMITGAFSDGFDKLYAARVIAAVVVLAQFRRANANLRPTLSWQAFASGALVFVAWQASGALGAGTATAGGSPSGLRSALSPAWASAWLIGRVVGSVLVAPLVEELAFRGYLVRRLMAADFEETPPGRLNWTSLIISSLLFGMLHQRWLAGAMAGAVYALAQRRRGELADAVVAHGTTNGLLAAYALSTGDWSSWS